MQALIAIVTLPLMLFNLFGGVVAGVWLLSLGEWKLFLAGLGASIFGVFILSLLLTPTMLVAGAGAVLHDRGGVGRLIAYPLMALGLLWTFIVMGGWAIVSLPYFLRHADSSSLIPLLIWWYGVAVGPWQYMASRESPDSWSGVTLFFFQIGCLIALVMIWPIGARPLLAVGAIVAALAVGFLVNIGAFTALVIAERQRRADVVASTEDIRAWPNSSDSSHGRGDVGSGRQAMPNKSPAEVGNSGAGTQIDVATGRRSECPDCKGTGLFKNEDICTRCKGWGTLPPPG